jgi:translation initiation factor 1
VSDRQNARLVYTTGIGRRVVCEHCGAPVESFRCSTQPLSGTRRGYGVARIGLDRKNRRGKMMTIISGAPGDDAALARMCRELKKLLATGGSVNGGEIELQGDHRERVAAFLAGRGIKAKRVGG